MKRNSTAGFSLIELMIVVAIIGVLSVVAIPIFTSYMHRAKVTEPVTFLGEIKQRQETYRAEFGQYGSAPTLGAATTCAGFTPAAIAAGGDSQAWGGGAAWTQLGASPNGAVRFQYCTFSNVPGTFPTGPGNLGYTGNDFWFVTRAFGDLDGDGNRLMIESYSESRLLYFGEGATGATPSAKGWE